MKRPRLHNNQGFTLAELVLAMALFSFLLLIITSSILQLYRMYQSGISIRDTQQQARLISEQISKDVKGAVHSVGVAGPVGAICIFYPPHSSQDGEKIARSVAYFVVDGGTPTTRTLRRGENPSAIIPATGPGTCTTGGYINNVTTLTSNSVSIALFGGVARNNVNAATLFPQNVMTYNLRIASRFAINDEIDMTDPANPRCIDGRQYCSMTSISNSAFLRSELE